jgi:hypothetical protein
MAAWVTHRLTERWETHKRRFEEDVLAFLDG